MIQYFDVLIKYVDGSYQYCKMNNLNDYVDLWNNNEIISIKKIGTYVHR